MATSERAESVKTHLTFGSLPDTPHIRTKIPGPKSSEALREQAEYESSSRIYTNFFPIAISHGKNASIVDLDGNVFLDWFAGVCVNVLGHANPLITEAISRQAERLVHWNDMPTETRLEFLKNLNDLLPKGLRDHAKVMFTITGADACEAAVSLARHVTGRRTVVAFSGAFHGVHGAIVGATANYKYTQYAGVPPYGVVHLPYPYTYRFPFRSSAADVSKVVIEMLEELLRNPASGAGQVAAVIVEPVQGEGGYVVPPDDFLPMLREVTTKHQIPLIADEIQSGLGRTGKVWAVDNFGVTPDLLCVSKAVGGGVPMSLIAYDAKYDEGLPMGFHAGTYRGNPVAIAAGNAVLGYLKSSNLIGEVEAKGRLFRKRMEEVQQAQKKIGEVRGLGLMNGVELVTDSASRNPGTDIAAAARRKLLDKGVLMHTCGNYANVLRLMPPLTIEKELLETGLDISSEIIESL